MTKNHLKSRGFTLIETIIYIALMALLIGGGVIASYYIIDSSEKGKAKINDIADGEFLVRKIDWALNSVDTIISPTTGPPASELRVNKNGFASNPIVIDLVSGHARISTGGGAPVELTGDRVNITNLSFELIPAVPPKPAAITANFNADGKHFETTKYLRK